MACCSSRYGGSWGLLVLTLAACATTTPVPNGNPKPPPVMPNPAPRQESPGHGATRTVAPPDDDGPDAESPEEIFPRVRAGLAKCYEQGRKDVPTMLSGRATFEVSIDAAGRAACVVVNEDSGLTQDVEDCMSERLAKEEYKTSSSPWATELPVVIDNGQIQLNPPTQGVQAFESVETHGLPSSASLVVQALIPELRGCTLHTSTSASLRMVHVGARIAKDGHVLCTVASSNSHVPVKMRDCAEAVMAAAKFPPPTGDVGLVSVPVNLSRR